MCREIEIKFDRTLISDIERGEKRATTRLTKKGEIGDHFAVGGKSFVLIDVVELPLSAACDIFHAKEGYTSAAMMEEAIKTYYPEIEGHNIVWVHEFTENGKEGTA